VLCAGRPHLAFIASSGQQQQQQQPLLLLVAGATK
jgi:hypothetical protein